MTKRYRIGVKMNIIQKPWWKLRYKIKGIKHSFEIKRYKNLYPDFEKQDEYDSGLLKYIWGIVSSDDSIGMNACLYTMNDIDIIYDRETKLYTLGIETAYIFKDKKGECEYLKKLLDAFTTYMKTNELNVNSSYVLFMKGPLLIKTFAETIEELYINFKIFVEGYCKVYEKE